MSLIARAAIQIQKPIKEVYHGITNPDILSQYFISESSGPMETGARLTWKFPEFPETFQVEVLRLDPPYIISFVWDKETVVTITLEQQPDNSTVIKAEESGKEFNEKNFQWAIANTEGWANFLACMKAWQEYKVPLRKGAFDFMKKK